MARGDSEACKPAADRSDLGIRLGVEALPSRDARREEAVFLQLSGEAPVDPGPLAEGALVKLLIAVTKAAGAPPPPLGRRRLLELLPDHLQRQELVPLQAQVPLQPLEALL